MDLTIPQTDRTSSWRAVFDIMLIGILWSVSSVGYYQIKTMLGLSNGYGDAPLLYSIYYLGGAAGPLLLLTPRNGATISYGLHWFFYMADSIYTHFFLVVQT